MISSILINWLKAQHRAFSDQEIPVAFIKVSLYSDSQKLIRRFICLKTSSVTPNK